MRTSRLATIALGGAVALTLGLAAQAQTTDPGPSAARVIHLDGSDTIVKVWSDAGPAGAAVPHYAISYDGQRWSEPMATDYTIDLRAGRFDPLADLEPPVPNVLAAQSADRADGLDQDRLYLVQFLTHPLPAYTGAIEALGGSVHGFMPKHARIVRMTPGVAGQVADLEFVRWVGDYKPAYRVEDWVIDNVDVSDRVYPVQRYYLMTLEPTMEMKQSVAERIEAIGGFVDSVSSGKLIMQATLTDDQLFEVLTWPETLWVNRWGAIEADMDNIRIVGGANYVETVAGYTGEGIRGEVLDLGFNYDHTDFASRPLIPRNSEQLDSHGASCSGIIFGDGTTDPSARGVAPDGQGMVSVANNSTFDFPGRYAHEAGLGQPPYEGHFHSSSVGHPRTFFYEAISAEMDAVLFDFDIVHFQSQSNAGNQDSRPEAWAKNMVSCGAVNHFNDADLDNDCWCGGASIGPASDGRIKPDLCFYYDSTRTVSCCGSTSYTSGFGGTSGATPTVAGHAGIFHQMWADGIFGNPIDPFGSVFDNRPHLATTKAVMINTARQYDFFDASDDLARNKQGWGMPDLQNLYDIREKLFVVDETDPILPGQIAIYDVNVLPTEDEVKFTMVYADPPGNPSAGQQRVNDLSIRVTSPSGVVYYGNVGLEEGNYSQPGGSLNDIDTVENVFVSNPEGGVWRVEVIASEIIEDGRPETIDLDADYALVVSGVEPILPPVVIAPEAPPSLIAPGVPTTLSVFIYDGAEEVVPSTATVHYRFSESAEFDSAPLVWTGGVTYEATIPGAPCNSTPQYFFSVEGSEGSVVTRPMDAPESFFEIAEVGTVEVVFADDFEEDTGWTVDSDPGLTAGEWERGVPLGGGDRGDPAMDFDGNGECYVTQNEPGDSDVDDGRTRLISPTFDLSDGDATVSWAYWYSNNTGADPSNDLAYIHVSNNGGLTWTEVVVYGPTSSIGWKTDSFRVSDVVEPTASMKLRFEVSDLNDGSIVEGGFDAFSVDRIVCDAACVADVDADGSVGTADLLAVLAAWGDCPGCPEDLDGNGVVETSDLLALLAAWGPCE